MKIKVFNGTGKQVESNANKWLEAIGVDGMVLLFPPSVYKSGDSANMSVAFVYGPVPSPGKAPGASQTLRAPRVRGIEEPGFPPECPSCGGVMIERHRKLDRAPFWGCAMFPRCRGAVDFDDADKAAAKEMEKNWMDEIESKPKGEPWYKSKQRGQDTQDDGDNPDDSDDIPF